MAAKIPLLEGTNLYTLPMGFKEVPEDITVQVELGLASCSYRFHWKMAGYNPWDKKKPHVKQQQFHDLDVRHKGFIAGIGSGKSSAAAAEAVKHLISYPGARAIVAAPSFPMLRKSTKVSFFEMLHPYSIARRNDQENVVELTNGSLAWFVSMDDPDSVRGPTVSMVVLDEGAYSPEKAWDILIGRLRQNGMPRKAILSTTPKGKNWVWSRFAGPNRKDSYAYIKASSRDNPHNPTDFIVALQEAYVGRFSKQEIDGDFVAPTGVVYPEFSRQIHVQKNVWERYHSTFKDIYYGHDWGYTHPMVIAAVGVDGDGRMYVFDEWYETRKTIEDVLTVLGKDSGNPESFYPKYGKGRHVCDPAQAEHIETLSRKGYDAVKGNNEILPGISEVESRLVVRGDGKPRLIIDEKCLNAIVEMEMYSFPENQDGKLVKDKPIDSFNHFQDVARYLAMYLRSPPNLYLTNKLDDTRGKGNPWKLLP